MADIWVTKTTFEKNANDGIEYFTNEDELADAVYANQESGGIVQVYKCVPVEHEVFVGRVLINLYERKDK